MKLAQALILRKDLKEQIYSLEQRISSNLLGQEGEEPSEEPNALIKEYEEKFDELQKIIARVNRTNAIVKFDDDMTIADCIAKKDSLQSMIDSFIRFVREASNVNSRYSKSEIKTVKYVDVAKMQKKINDLSKKYRDLDMKLQEKNWVVDLLD